MSVADVLTELTQKLDFTLVLLTGSLLMARIVPVIILSPFLGEANVPTELKIGMGLTLTVVMFPGVYDRMSYVPISAIPYIALLMKEIFIGMSLAFIVSFIFEAASAAGNLIDTVSGSNQATLFVPELQLNVTLFANLKTQLTVVLFLTLNGHHLVIEGLAESLAAVPLDQFPKFSNGTWPFFEAMIQAFAMLMKVSLALAAPVIMATLLVDLSLGMMNRVAPRIQIFALGLSIKPMVTFAVMMFAIHLIVNRIHDEFQTMLQMFRQLIKSLA